MNRIAIITQCYITYNFKKIDKRNSIKNKILQLSTLSIVLVYSFFVATIPTEYINNFSLYNSKIYPFYRNLYISNISLYSRYESPEIIAVKYYKTGNIVQSKMELNDPINLSERDLHGATFSNVTFPKIKISRSSNFNSSDFIDVNFYNCSISNDFKTTSFTRCNFNNCTIYETTIGDESLIYFCNFSQCKLEGIHIYSSDFESNLFSDSNFDTIHTSNSIIDENTYLDCKYIDTTSSKSEFSNNMLINSDAFNPQIYSSYLSSNTIFDSKIKNLFIHKITIESNTICNLEIINPVILASDTTNLSLINTQLIAPKVSLTKISNLTTFASDTLKNTITGRKKTIIEETYNLLLDSVPSLDILLESGNSTRLELCKLYEDYSKPSLTKKNKKNKVKSEHQLRQKAMRELIQKLNSMKHLNGFSPPTNSPEELFHSPNKKALD
mgnify:CR=1 FL=1